MFFKFWKVSENYNERVENNGAKLNLFILRGIFYTFDPRSSQTRIFPLPTVINSCAYYQRYICSTLRLSKVWTKCIKPWLSNCWENIKTDKSLQVRHIGSYCITNPCSCVKLWQKSKCCGFQGMDPIPLQAKTRGISSKPLLLQEAFPEHRPRYPGRFKD